RCVHLEIVGAVAASHGHPAAGTVAARLDGVLAIVPAAAAHAADAGRRRLAAAVVAAEDHAARVANQDFFTFRPVQGWVVGALPHLIVAAGAVLGAKIVVAAGHGSYGKREECRDSNALILAQG